VTRYPQLLILSRPRGPLKRINRELGTREAEDQIDAVG
jgi:hypothetical protein